MPPSGDRSSPLVLVSVVVHADHGHVRRCVELLLPAGRDGDLRIVLTDNGAPPAAAAVLDELAAEHPGRVHVVRSAENVGFAAAHVRAVAEHDDVPFTHVLLLNDDAELDAATLERLVDAADRAGADVAAPAIVLAADPQRLWQAGARVIAPLGHLRNPWRGRRTGDLPGAPWECDFVSGCAMLVRRASLVRFGFLDSAYFYSVEDLDLCLRVRRGGGRVVCVPGCVARHHVAATAGGWNSRFAIVHNLWGRARLVARHGASGMRWMGWLLLVGVVLPARVLRAPVRGRGRLRLVREGVAAIAAGARGAPAPRVRVSVGGRSASH